MEPPLSYSRGPALAILQTTTHELVADKAARFPDHLALVSCHQRIRLTWHELAEQVERTARGLAGLGLRPGDRVGVWATNCVEWVYLQLACARAGIVQVNVNPAYRSAELEFVLRRSGMKALVLRGVRCPHQLRGDARRGDARRRTRLARRRLLARRHAARRVLGSGCWTAAPIPAPGRRTRTTS